MATQTGGSHGGGAVLTPFGNELVSTYRSLEAELHRLAADRLEALDSAARSKPGFGLGKCRHPLYSSGHIVSGRAADEAPPLDPGAARGPDAGRIGRGSGEGVLVFAAASLKNALDEVIAAYGQETGTKVTASYAASSALAKQIEQGAPAQLFISADLDWMDYLDAARPDRRRTRARTCWATAWCWWPARTARWARWRSGRASTSAALLGDGRLAVGEVKAVPAGKYAKASLEHLGAWGGVEGKLAQAENVRAALALVARGEAPLGIVYKTDAASDPSVRIVGTFPADSHPPIIYPAAADQGGRRQRRRRLPRLPGQRRRPRPRSRSRASP